MLNNFFFDYIYYRLFLLNSNKGEYQGIPPAVVISLLQIMLLFDLQIFLFESFFESSILSRYSSFLGNGAVLLFVILVILNFRKYRNMSEGFESRWKDEDVKVRRRKGVLVFVSIILPFMPLTLITHL